MRLFFWPLLQYCLPLLSLNCFQQEEHNSFRPGSRKKPNQAFPPLLLPSPQWSASYITFDCLLVSVRKPKFLLCSTSSLCFCFFFLFQKTKWLICSLFIFPFDYENCLRRLWKRTGSQDQHALPLQLLQRSL